MTKPQAMRALREYVEQATGLRPDQRSTVAWFIAHRWIPLREGTWRDSTRQTNMELLKIIEDRFGKTPLEEMDLVEMQKWVNDLAKKKSGSVVKHCRIFLKSIMSEAAEQDFVRKNPARSLRLPKLKAVRKNYLSEPEIKALLEAAKFFPRDRVLLKLMLGTGMRPGELFALRWKCMNADCTTMTLMETVYRGKLRPFTKTTEEGDTDFVTVILPKVVANDLSKLHYEDTEYAGADDFIFHNTEGGFITKENYVHRVLNPLADRAGVKRFNFQVLRRSVATHMQHHGSPKDIQTILRHRKPGTAQAHYVQAIDASVREATEKLAAALLK